MKYIMLLLFLVQGIYKNLYSQEKDWCINSGEVIEWTLIDNKGEYIVLSKEEIDALSTEEYKSIYENLTVERIVFSDKSITNPTIKKIVKANWCMNSLDVSEWNLVDKKGRIYVFTSKELNTIPKEDYDKIYKHLRVKRVVFRADD